MEKIGFFSMHFIFKDLLTIELIQEISSPLFLKILQIRIYMASVQSKDTHTHTFLVWNLTCVIFTRN